MTSNRSDNTNNDHSKSIIPLGFESMAHPIFFKYKKPTMKNDKSDRIEGIEFNFNAEGSTDRNVDTSKDNKDQVNNIDIDAFHAVQCSVCLTEVEDQTTLVDCCHVFCFDCIMAWFEIRQNCPICKVSSNHIIKSCSISKNHPFGVQVFKIMDSNREKEIKSSAVLATTLNISIRKHLSVNELLINCDTNNKKKFKQS